MLKTIKTAVAMGAAAMLLCGSAFAADAAGEQPLEEVAEDAALATPSTETRAQVEAEAAAQPPAAGQAPLEEKAEEAALSTPSSETRSEVESEAAQNPPAAGQTRKK